MLDHKQFQNDILVPALKGAGLWQLNAERLVFGTALIESGLRAVRQYNGGPALGLCQMEPATYHDHWEWLGSRPALAERIVSAAGMWAHHAQPEEMIWNMAYSVLMCRVHYLRRPEPLPHADDIGGLAEYWKRWYNTPLGKGSPQKFAAVLEKHL